MRGLRVFLARLGFCDMPCGHIWRPAVLNRRIPVRFCDLCEITERLTVEEFYARFGRMPW